MTVIRRSQRNTGGQFAKGKKAIAVCQRSGMKYLQKDMVFEPGTGYFVHKSESDGAYNLITDKLNYPAPVLREPESVGLKYSSPEVALSVGTVVSASGLDVPTGYTVNNQYLDNSALYPNILEDGIHFNFLTDTYWVQASGTRATTKTFAELFTCTVDTNSYFRGSNGLLQHPATSSTPRVEYDANGNKLGILIEGTRTNLAIRSQEMDNASWTKSNATVAADQTLAPDGTLTADKLQEDATAGIDHLISVTVNVTSGTQYTFSCFFKAAEQSWIRMQVASTTVFPTSPQPFQFQFFDLANGVLGGSGGLAFTNAEITPYANGWYRCSFTTVAATASGTTQIVFYMANANNQFAHNGVAGNGVYAWGCQWEAGTTVSSYIPTTTTAVARTSDHLFYIMGSEWKEGPGTIRATVRIPSNPTALPRPAIDINFNTAGYARRHQLTAYVGSASSNSQYAVVADDLSVPVGGLQVAAAVLTKNVAAAWDTDNFGHAANGTASVLDQAGVLPTGLVRINFGEDDGSGQAGLFGWIQKFDYWPGRATTDELRVMTRL